jgi:hypothetical protein
MASHRGKSDLSRTLTREGLGHVVAALDLSMTLPVTNDMTPGPAVMIAQANADDGQQVSVCYIELETGEPLDPPAHPFCMFDGWHYLELSAALEAVHGPVRIFYHDDEDDRVAIKTHEELIFAAALAKDGLTLLIACSQKQKPKCPRTWEDDERKITAEDPEDQYIGATGLFAQGVTTLFAQVDEYDTERQETYEEDGNFEDGHDDYVGATAMLGGADPLDESEMEKKDWEEWLEGLEEEGNDGIEDGRSRADHNEEEGGELESLESLDDENAYVGATVMLGRGRGVCDEKANAAKVDTTGGGVRRSGGGRGGAARGGAAATRGVADGGVRRSATRVKGTVNHTRDTIHCTVLMDPTQVFGQFSKS